MRDDLALLLVAALAVVATAGYRLRIQSRLLNMNVVYTYLVFLGATGFLMDEALSWLRRKTCPWFGE